MFPRIEVWLRYIHNNNQGGNQPLGELCLTMFNKIILCQVAGHLPREIFLTNLTSMRILRQVDNYLPKLFCRHYLDNQLETNGEVL